MGPTDALRALCYDGSAGWSRARCLIAHAGLFMNPAASMNRVHVCTWRVCCQTPLHACLIDLLSHSAAHAGFGHRRQVPHRLPSHHLHVVAATARAGPRASVAKPGQDGNSAMFQTNALQINMQGFFETRISRAMTARSHVQPNLKYSPNKTETCQVAERTAHRQSRSQPARTARPTCRSCPPCCCSRPGSALLMPTTALEPCHP